jgi:hypothetical protein
VVPPSPPPVNPAPPSGSAARKEAKQRQAATAKSEEGGGEGAEETSGLGGDLATGRDGATGAAITRRDRVKPGWSVSSLPRRSQPSAWPRELPWGGGLALAALALALTFSVVGPTPRRRRPEVAAPAWARRRG